MQAHLVQHLPRKKVRRFYILYITPTLFGEWALIHEWGRLGRRGRRKEEWFASSTDAGHAAAAILAEKTELGYKQRPIQLKLF
ncbi:MAG: WGR domain-containing protein [Bacteroidota bacterium]